jgi:3-hydroxyacyl-CoA dehydrogenase
MVIARVTPNFIGNRIGVFSMLADRTDSRAGFDTVDALTVRRSAGRRPPTAPRTGQPGHTMAHVIKTMADTLPDDPWHSFKAPKWLAALIEKARWAKAAPAAVP